MKRIIDFILLVCAYSIYPMLGLIFWYVLIHFLIKFW